MHAQVSIVFLSEPGFFRSLHAFVQQASEGSGRLEVQALAATAEGQPDPDFASAPKPSPVQPSTPSLGCAALPPLPPVQAGHGICTTHLPGACLCLRANGHAARLPVSRPFSTALLLHGSGSASIVAVDSTIHEPRP